jgi:ADP-ribosylglycohydrolase
MRIIPLVFSISDKNISERYEITKKVSSITHAHIRSVIACFYYLEFARKLIQKLDKFQIYDELKKDILSFIESQNIDNYEIDQFSGLLVDNIFEFSEDDIRSSGYVVHTLEAAVWCLLTTNSYEKCVLKAVNLGEDTDTTAAVAGGLAGLLYGVRAIPPQWLRVLKRRDEIEKLCEKLGYL